VIVTIQGLRARAWDRPLAGDDPAGLYSSTGASGTTDMTLPKRSAEDVVLSCKNVLEADRPLVLRLVSSCV
jgi:hypothetical protein